MSALRFALLATLTGALTAGSVAAPLRIIRTTPVGDAGPLPAITVTFDRPVAGSLDRTVDPATVLQVEPAIPGRLEWRDPITIRLIPSAPLPPDTRYTVTISTAFTAMDGERLPEPVRFTFRVRGPVLLATRPLRSEQVTEHITPDQRFDLIYGAPVDLARLSAATFIEMSAVCGGGNRIIPVRATSQRRLTEQDGWQIRDAGGYRRDRAADSLRRLVQVVPQRPLPHGCAGVLAAPTELSEGLPQGLTRWAFRTYGDFRIASAQCEEKTYCPKGPANITFSNPVRGADVQRLVKIYPATPFVVRDTSATSAYWTLEAPLVPNRTYAIVVDTLLRDIFGQKLTGNPAVGLRTTGYATAISYPFGRQLVERKGFQTLAIQHVNVDTLVALIAPVPDSLEASFLSSYGWSDNEKWNQVAKRAETRRLPVRAGTDTSTITGLRLPVADASQPGAPTLYAVRVLPARTRGAPQTESPVSLVQVTDIGITARIGMEEGMVWVTGVSDGLPRAGARVILRSPQGKVIASGQTDARGLAQLTGYRFAPGETDDDDGSSLEGYVSATLGNDRGLVAINRYDPDLSPWNFGVQSAWGDSRYPLAGAVFTERGIYRPGEQVYAKAIVRTGNLGALTRPALGDSLKWVFTDREGETLADTTVRISEFGTASHILTIPAGAPIGYYGVRIQMKRLGGWREVASAGYRVAEYRPPEFLVDVGAEQAPSHPGEKFRVGVHARYLFGAPMGRAAVQWTARQASVGAWDLDIPGTDGWQVGETGWWWDADNDGGADFFANGTDTLDARGELTIETTLPAAKSTRASRVTIEATVTDVNRQTVGSSTTALVHPASFYIAAKPRTESWFWRAGEAQAIAVRAVHPDGTAESGVRVRGTLVRREWHQVRRERGGVAQLVGEWVSDTVARCTATTAAANPPSCALTPAAGGMHMVILEATDAQGRRAATSFGRYVAGAGFVPWSDETQFKMEVIADRERYSVGDTATVMLASPFTDAEAWITVEREGIIEQRRMRLTSGATTIKFPITEAYAPNAFVSVVVARGRSAPPGKLDDAGRPTLRVGYARLRVTPEVKRLTVAVQPVATFAAEYRPGDSARVRLTVRDARGAGARSEVTLWAVDEGVLALTGYKLPDPISLLYQERGLGMRLASNLVAVAPQIPEGEKGRREAGGGGGAAGAEVLRSRFKTTAFFLGSIITDASGSAVVSAKLPDNLTTFRVMAVAVTAGDRYGSGASSLLVTRPLVARPALPRFVRPSDQLLAGTVVNRRDGSVTDVRVTATATGIERTSPADRTATLAASRGTEVRFRFRALPGDSATFRFDARSGSDVDAVQLRVPIQPDYHPRSYTVAGVLRDTATAEFLLPQDIDPARSRLTLNLGTSPLAIIRGIQRDMHVYPYYCTEQVVSVATPILALLRAERVTPGIGSARGRADIERAVAMISGRQRDDGGIGYWSPTDWTTPWLSAYAGHVLLDARDVGIAVDSGVVARLADYLRATLRGEREVTRVPVAQWYERRTTRLADQVAAADLLSRLGTPDVGAENELVRMSAQMTREDRIRLATVLHRRGATEPARALISVAWAEVRVEGRRAVLPPVTERFYFDSRVREEARLLLATLAIEPGHALIGPLVETLVQQGRAEHGWMWNTQDYAFIVQALAEFERSTRASGGRAVRVRAGGRTILQASSASSTAPMQGDTSIALEGLLDRPRSEQRALRLSLDMPPGPSAAAYYYLTVTEIPLRPPVRPDDAGIRVERWYESYDSARPVTSVVEGDLVRVRLKVTVPAIRHFVVLDDALPAGLEAIDLSLRTSTALPGPAVRPDDADAAQGNDESMWGYGSWDSGWWTAWDHRELRDDRVVYAATVLWPGTYTASYVARATTPGVFIRPPAHAEEMYNPALHGRSDGGVFTVTERPPR
jgi:uncharacterized protein YfaS (alpha-2-macroglobulin family)